MVWINICETQPLGERGRGGAFLSQEEIVEWSSEKKDDLLARGLFVEYCVARN